MEQCVSFLAVRTEAQTSAIEALANAQGADPGQIAGIVEKAVAGKLTNLRITIG